MFPIRWNFPFRKKDGSMSTIGAEIEEGGGSYTLPTASAETKGGVKIGSGLAMEGEVLNNSNPTPYSLPTASDQTLGGIKVGSGLSIDDGVLSASAGSNIYNHFVTVKNTVDANKVICAIGFTSSSNDNINTIQKLYDVLGLNKEIPYFYTEAQTVYHTVQFKESGGTTLLYLGGAGYGFGQCAVSDVIL